MDLEVFSSPEHVEEEEVTSGTVVEARSDVPQEQTPSEVVAGVLSESASQEEVAESESSDKGDSIEAPTLTVKENGG